MKNFEFVDRALRWEYRAGNLPLIGTGAFACVFGIDEQLALKVTCDPASVAMLSWQPRSLKLSPAFPVVFADLGIVARCDDCRYHAFVVERLSMPQVNRTDGVFQIFADVRQMYDVEALSPVVDAAYLRALAAKRALGMHAEMLALARMVDTGGWLVDSLGRGNLLQRATGQLCLSDPLYSLVQIKRRAKVTADV